jgi:hypothetical protein
MDRFTGVIDAAASFDEVRAIDEREGSPPLPKKGCEVDELSV